MVVDLADDCWDVIFSHLDKNDHFYYYKMMKPVTLVCKRFLAISNGRRHTLILRNRLVPATVPPALFSRFPNLAHISLNSYTNKIGLLVKQLAISDIPLKSISISFQPHFPRRAMRLLGHSKRNTLRSLTLSHFGRLTGGDLIVMANSFFYLHDLKLCGPRFNGTKKFITDEAIRAISVKLVSLVSFTIRPKYDDKISRLSFDYLSSHCLSLANLEFMDYQGRLRAVELDWFASFKSLKTLKLKYVNITDRGLVHLSSTGNFKLLSKLNLRCALTYNVNVSGTAMCQFLKSCSSLTSLRLNGMRFSPDTEEIDFAASIAKTIRVVSLRYCFNLPNTMFYNVVQRCPNLEKLRLPDTAVIIVEDSLDLFVHHCLEILSLKGTNLTYKALKLICHTFPGLIKFDILQSFGLSADGLKEIFSAGSGTINSCFTDYTSGPRTNFHLYQDYESDWYQFQDYTDEEE